MDEDEFAWALLAHERREWQNPDEIVTHIGIKKGMIVADLACGPGFFIVPLARAVEQTGRVYAVDKSRVMLNYLRSNLKRAKINLDTVKIIQSDVSKTSIPSSSCDIVLFANVLHDIEDHNKFLTEVRRISKKRVRVVDIDWKDVDNGIGPPVEIRLSESRSKEILEKNGFELEKKIDAGPYHYGLVLQAA